MREVERRVDRYVEAMVGLLPAWPPWDEYEDVERSLWQTGPRPTADDVVAEWRTRKSNSIAEAIYPVMVERVYREARERERAEVEGIRRRLAAWLARVDTDPRWECQPCRSPGLGSVRFNLPPRPPPNPRVTSRRGLAIADHIEQAPDRLLWKAAALIYTLKFIDRHGHAEVIDGWIADLGTTDTTNLEVHVSSESRGGFRHDVPVGAFPLRCGGPRRDMFVMPPSLYVDHRRGNGPR